MSAVSRRTVLGAGVAFAGAAVVGGCTPADSVPSFVGPHDEEVRLAERRRRRGPVREFRLTAAPARIDLGGPAVDTWAYDGAVPGPPIRVTAGEVVRATVANRLPAETSVHWHGVALRNDADGAPPVTQQPVRPGDDYIYEFAVAHPGTYWFHPHSGTQLDRGLYAPLIVDDPAEPGLYDEEWVVVLDDWLDGAGDDPDSVLTRLRAGGGMHGGRMGGPTWVGGSSALLGGDAGDVRYPYFLLNGRVSTAPVSFAARPGMRVRLRLVNAAADTAFRVALTGHRLRVTHADGFAVEPVDVDAVLLGMGERYDVLVTLAGGAFGLVALAEGKDATARAVVRTGAGTPPGPYDRPRELGGRVAGYRMLRPMEAVRLPGRRPDRTIRLDLTGGMHRYEWGFNGHTYDPERIEAVRQGERVRLRLTNRTMMWHPVHLHGHTFALGGEATRGHTGVRKDTAIVFPGQRVDADFDADNPGLWMIHCHNVYHAEAGMMTTLGYRR